MNGSECDLSHLQCRNTFVQRHHYYFKTLEVVNWMREELFIGGDVFRSAWLYPVNACQKLVVYARPKAIGGCTL